MVVVLLPKRNKVILLFKRDFHSLFLSKPFSLKTHHPMVNFHLSALLKPTLSSNLDTTFGKEEKREG